MNLPNQLIFGLLMLSSLDLLANNVNGIVRNAKNEPIPYARVAVKNNKKGAITNLNGEFTIYLPDGNYTLKVQSLGYKPKEQTIQVTNDVEQVQIILEERGAHIEKVVVNNNKKDLTKQIIRNAQRTRKQNQAYLQSFKADFYCKNTLENVGSKQNDSLKNQPERENVYFQELYSNLYFKRKNRFKEVRQGYRDYQFKEYVQPNSSIAIGLTIEGTERGDFYEQQTLETNPMHIVHNRQEANFNLYQNALNIPMFSETPFTSPIGDNALLVYNFNIESSFYQDGQKIYEIKVWPKFKQSNLVSGTILIEDETFALVSSAIEFPAHALYFLGKFDLVQNYIRMDSAYVLESEEYIYHSKSKTKSAQTNKKKNDGEERLDSSVKRIAYSYGNTYVQYKNYLINPNIANSFMNSGLQVYADDTDSLGDHYWEQVRPHTLKPKELAFIKEQDSIVTHRNSYEFLRKQDSIINHFKWYNVLLTGVSHINRPKGMTYYFNPLLLSVRPFAVGGYRHALGGTIEKKWENKKKLKTAYEINYGFRNENVKGSITLDYTFDPKKYSSFFIRGGDNYAILNNDESVIATFSRSNYVRKLNAGFGGKHEIRNGLLASASLDFSTFHSITNLELAPWSEKVFGGYNIPQNFPGYNQMILEAGLTWVPKMKYIMTKYEKISKGSDYPRFTLNYVKGIKPFFNSDVNYDYLNLKVSQDIKIGTMGTSKYRVDMGRFLNNQQIRIADQKFFRSSDRYFLSNPVYTFQHLDTSLRTTQAFFQGQYLHQFNGALMNKIPLINKLKLTSMAGAGLLLLEQGGYRHSEIFAGLSKSFNIKGQVFKITAAYVSSVNSVTGTQGGFKFGIDFFDSWSNKWSY